MKKTNLTLVTILLVQLNLASAGTLGNLIEDLKKFKQAIEVPTSALNSGSKNSIDTFASPNGSVKANSIVNEPVSKVVEAIGVGETLETAKEDAIRQAVQKAVGSYVTSDLITKNDEVIKDKVLSLSSGFVEKIEVISQGKRSDGLVETKIKATVTSTKLRRALEDQNISTTDLDSESLFGEAITKLDNTNTTIDIWNNILPKMMVSGFEAKLIGKPEVEPIGGDKVFVKFKVLVDWNPAFKSEMVTVLKTTSSKITNLPKHNLRCVGIIKNAKNAQCYESKDVVLKENLEAAFKKYNSALKIDIDVKSASGEVLTNTNSCIGQMLGNQISINPFVAVDRGVQVFIDELPQNFSGNTITNLNRFQLVTSLNSNDGEIQRKFGGEPLEYTNSSFFYLKMGLITTKHELSQFKSVDVKTSGCVSKF
jgi:hypothetical protein